MVLPRTPASLSAVDTNCAHALFPKLTSAPRNRVELRYFSAHCTTFWALAEPPPVLPTPADVAASPEDDDPEDELEDEEEDDDDEESDDEAEEEDRSPKDVSEPKILLALENNEEKKLPKIFENPEKTWSNFEKSPLAKLPSPSPIPERLLIIDEKSKPSPLKVLVTVLGVLLTRPPNGSVTEGESDCADAGVKAANAEKITAMIKSV